MYDNNVYLHTKSHNWQMWNVTETNAPSVELGYQINRNVSAD
jgi:hypothetical protein